MAERGQGDYPEQTMPTRREFISSVVGATLLGGCSSKSPKKQPRAASPAAPPPRADPGAGDEAPPTRREDARPALEVPRDDALANIRKHETPGPDLVEVTGNDAGKMLALAIPKFSGDKPLVRRGDRVVITPNFALARGQGTGVATEASLVKAMIQYCEQAEARDITVLDHSYHPAPRAFRVNGAFEAVQGTSARLISPWSPDQYVVINDFQSGKLHREELKWQAVPETLLRCDVLINMPVFKHHRDAGMSGAVKKLMGCIWRRAVYHDVDLHACIGELAAVLKPTFTVMDAIQVLATNGPDGPGKVKPVNRLLLSADAVLADTYACSYLDMAPKEIAYLKHAADLGAGLMDVKGADVKRIVS